MKIVIADDNPDILETTVMALELDGHDCVPAPVASEILAIVQAAAADVLLQDIRMPGLDLAAHLRRVHDACPLPVVVFSAEQPDPHTRDLPGVVGFLRKPFELAELRAVLAPLLDKS